MNARSMPARKYPADMVTHLGSLAGSRPDDTALIVAEASGGEKIIVYAELESRTRALAAHLQSRFDAGDRALILLDNDDNYVVAFLACLYAGLIAVPAAIPESRRERHLDRLRAMAANSKAHCVLSSGHVLASIGQLPGSIETVTFDRAAACNAADWKEHVPAAGDIAFLQYTSGSTSAPKGVVITHGNLMANERAIQAGMSVTADDRFVSWLPLFHDMGLIGGLLQPLHRGIPLVLASPGYFMQQPLRWLQLISRHRATLSGGPDFAYRLCTDRVTDAQLQSLDLSSWRVAFSGAEPVRPDTLHAFAERFAPAGFDAKAIYPCYGLAEATLFVTGGKRGTGVATTTEEARTFVACGSACAGHRVEIVAAGKGKRVAAGQVGEIQVSGPSVSPGYWELENETAATFVERDGARWLRTGDLGFLRKKQLYVTGRMKDLIILRGQNVYPQDIERAIEAEVEAVRKGRVAAFGVPTENGEAVGVAAEISRGLQKLVAVDRLVAELSAAVSDLCHEPLAVVVLLNPGALPKTSSGKLQRSACRNGWLAGTLDAYAIYEHGRFVSGGLEAQQSPTLLHDVERALAEIWQSVLKCGEVRRDAHFFSSGGNSLTAVQVAARIEAHWDVGFSVRMMFEHPRLGENAAQIERLVNGGVRPKATSITASTADRRGTSQPLSYAQSRQWFLWQMDRQSTAYHIFAGLRLRGTLDVEALHSGVGALVSRHSALRTVFRKSSDGSAEQIILAASPIDIIMMDLSGRGTGIETELRGITHTPFDLAHGPLFRVALLRLSSAEHLLIMGMHHIVSDGRSMQVVVDEFAEFYRAAVERRQPALGPLPVEYVDYAMWQRNLLAAGEKERQLEYWSGQLGAEQPLLRLPADRPRIAAQSYRAAHRSFELSQSLLDGLRSRTEEHRATLFMTLLAGFYALLHRYTGQNDIRIGVPNANRNHPQTHGIVGLFVNTQVLRARVESRTTLGELLDLVREAVLGAQEHQDLPFEQLVEALQPQRSLDHHPLFQVMMNHQRHDYRALENLPGLAVEKFGLDESRASFELTLRTIERAGGGVSATLIYAAELFDADTIARMERDYLALLQALVEWPGQAIGEALPDTTAPTTQFRESPFEPAHLRIARSAAQFGDQPALHCEGRTLSYAELDRWSDRVALNLRAMGVAAETRVGLCVERSVGMVAALLGILKSGGAFVPLDPAYPTARLSHMIDDARLHAVVVDSDSSTRCAAVLAGCGQVRVDLLEAAPDTAVLLPQISIQPQQLAYVIYTSGSTGLPKGVAITHRALSLHLDDFIGRYGIAATDKLLHSSTINFDVALHELLPALMMGGQVHMRGPRLWELDSFNRTLRDEQVTFARIPTAYWQQWLRALPNELPRLRQITVGGEALPGDGLARWLEGTLKAIPVDNLYGPTETTIACLAHRCAVGDTQMHTVPIGKPYPSRGVRVIDADCSDVPVGAWGELCISGDTLARGYLDRPGLTAERFIADPAGGGKRIYRSGDLCRQRANGVVDYLGRLDQQVKLRGHRIELGEVEVAVRRCGGVKEAVVELRGHAERQRLIAYVVGTAEPAALRAELQERLPDYMLPGVFVRLAGLPMNPNGKVDRKALPEPEAPQDRAYESPQGSTEATLATLWMEALNAARVGRNDNFFDLGGHSLLLLQVHSRLQETLHVNPSIVDLFKYPTIATLAAFLQTGAPEAAPLQFVEERAKRQRTAFLSKRAAADGVPT